MRSKYKPNSIKLFLTLSLFLVFGILYFFNYSISGQKNNSFLYNLSLLAVHDIGEDEPPEPWESDPECDSYDGVVQCEQGSTTCSGSCGCGSGQDCTFGTGGGSCECFDECIGDQCGGTTTKPPKPPTLPVTPPAADITPPPVIDPPGCSSSNGVSGTCGSSNNQVFSSFPATNLCNSGYYTPTDSNGTDGRFNWDCRGGSGSCGGSSGSTASCSAVAGVIQLVDVQVNDYTGIEVSADSGDRYQICDPDFKDNNTVQLVVTGNDPVGINNIKTIELYFSSVGATYEYSTSAVLGGVGIFNIDFNVLNDETYNLYTNFINLSNANSGWINTGITFKNWGCQVSFSGSFYDNSIGTNCNFSTKMTVIPQPFGLSLYSGSLNNNLTITNPDYNGGSSKLFWGKDYISELNDAPGMLSNIQVIGTGTTCLSLNSIDTKIADPYADNPSMTIDYSLIINQTWFQTVGGGVIGGQSVSDNIPAMCTLDSTCKPAMSISGTNAQSGVVSSKTDSNSCGLDGSNCQFGDQGRVWKVKSNLTRTTYNYDYFYRNYFQKLGQGVTIPVAIGSTTTMTQILANSAIGGTGVIFINGDLNIDQNNTLGAGKYLMIVVKGDIDVNTNTNSLNGIFIANNISVGGTSASELNINGTLYSPSGDVKLTRGFTNIVTNSNTPAVSINYSPSLIFNMPGKLVKLISGWKQGI